MASHYRLKPRLLEHVAAGALAGCGVGVVDALLAVYAPGLKALSSPSVDGVFTLTVGLWLVAGLFAGLLTALLVSVIELALGSHLALMAVATGDALKRILVLLMCLVGTLVGLRIFLKPIEWDAVPWEIPAALFLGMVVYACGLVAARQGARTAVALTALALLGACAPSLPNVTNQPLDDDVLDRMAGHTMCGRSWLPMARTVYDADGDGYPTRLCGTACDCDDANGDISPGSLELAGNGIDEDCSGGDLSAEAWASYGAFATVTHEDLTDEEQAEEHAGPMNILFIVVDTLRADHLGLYGYHKPTSPNLDRFVEDALVFDQARATGSQTRFSVPPMMVGKYFTELDRTAGQWPGVGDHEELISERLQRAGYQTAAFHSIGYMRARYGLSQGFDHYDESLFDVRPQSRWGPTSDYITDQVLAYADGQDLGKQDPFFMWVYYSDPHSPYKCYEPFRHMAGGRVQRYDCEIAFTDHHLGRLLEGLEDRGLLENTLVAFASDHGEGLDEEDDHGSLYHGPTLYDEVVKVPLIMKMPNGIAGRTSVPVSLVDLAPTFLAAAGLDPVPEMRGVSLMPYLRGEDPPHPPVFFEKHKDEALPQKGMVAWPYKVIRKMPWGRPLIYNLAEDPRERRNIRAEMDPSERDRLEGMLAYWISSLEEGVILAHRTSRRPLRR